MSRAYKPEKKTANERQSSLSDELYREIFVHSNEPIAILDPQGYYIEQNSAHRELLGYDDDELKGKTPAIHLGEDVFQSIAAELAEKGEYRGEILSRRKTGEVRNIEISAFATRDDAGNPTCYVAIKRDVTERKQGEEALRRTETELTDFFETATIGLHWVDPAGIVIRVNQAELDLLGYSREEYIGPSHQRVSRRSQGHRRHSHAPESGRTLARL